MRELLRRIPLPGIGYVLFLIGFVALGVFVASLALETGIATAAGIATVLAFGLSAASFKLRKFVIDHSRGDDALLNVDPLGAVPISSVARSRYLERYRRGAQAPAHS
ncbi:hypothetical protein M1247_36020 [Mycobacterium sp. 21AC1]|uniref:hypothetical protein n=1 Tax=[Mycobacterium] appelbergii TaxID=2939269 RepID=UPI0029394533|nr:hypothetical protein [Mycobacterium sp. 21AC1]MDV3130355.1 hypothetical protein [Mycobacterium sp. 21AC1]